MGDEKLLRVVVLTGGTSAEREVCLMSGRKVMGALDRERYEAVSVDLADITASGDVAPLLSAFGPGQRPDVVFVALHGGAGENGTVQTNSWGAGTNNPMDYQAREGTYDRCVRDADPGAAGKTPLIICFSAGNSGGAGLTRVGGHLLEAR